jgi:hypothetical protein
MRHVIVRQLTAPTVHLASPPSRGDVTYGNPFQGFLFHARLWCHVSYSARCGIAAAILVMKAAIVRWSDVFVAL